LSQQLIVAYENDRPVMISRVASGFGDHRTPAGRHTVLSKCPAARMTGGVGNDFYDLPGVPFPTFFTPSMAGSTAPIGTMTMAARAVTAA